MPHPHAVAGGHDESRGPALSETSTALVQLDRCVERLVRERPALASALRLQARLAREGLLAARTPEAPALVLSSDRAREKIGSGVPLLHDEAVHVDVIYAGDLFGRLVNVVSATASEPTEALHGQDISVDPLAMRIGSLVAAATAGRLDPYALFREAFVQHRDHLADIARAAAVDPDLLVVLASLSVAPLLGAYARPLAAAYLNVETNASLVAVRWRKSYCPVCGAWPIFGELRGLELQRHLRCAACGTSWPSRRLTCVYCDNEEFRLLERLQADGAGERRLGLDACRRCQGYLKVVNALTPTPPHLLLLEDIASAHLDVVAVERGFRRSATAGYRLETANELPDIAQAAELPG